MSFTDLSFTDLLEKAIATISPRWALAREANKLALLHFRGYSGATIKKSDKHWLPTRADADRAILPYLARLRARSRDLTRNNPFAISVLNTVVRNVTGVSGIIAQGRSKNSRENDDIENYFDEKFKANEIDYSGYQDFYELQSLALRQILESGESFIKINFDGSSSRPRGIKLQFLEADQIWSNKTFSENGNEIREGIEIDKTTGKHVAYYINDHPGSYGFSRQEEKKVPAIDMIHLFFRERPGQTRGVPFVAPVLNQLHDLGEYIEAELVAARVAACLSVLIKRNYHSNPSKNEDGDNIQNLHPGMIARLKPGEDVSVIDPKRPGDQFSNFVAFQIRAIAAGCGLSYESISKDYSNVNYSSGRMGLLGDRLYYRTLQRFMIKHFCDRISGELQDLRILRGEQRAKIKVIWLAPGFEWVDPQKEITGNVLAIENNLKTKAQVVAEAGGDLDEVFLQRSEEVKKEKELGIEKITNETSESVDNESEYASELE